VRIAIIGATSFIGGALMAQLVEQGHHVTPVYRRQPAGGGVWWGVQDKIQGDIRDDSVLDAIVSRAPDVCVYLISLNHMDSAASISQVLPVNLSPMWRLFERLSQNDWRGKIIYLSTQQVYGLIGGDTVDELYPARPRNQYALTHYMSERVCEYYDRNYEFSIVSVRLSNSYGVPAFKSTDCWWTVINDLAKTLTETGMVTLKSDGSPLRDFVNVEDVALFISKLCTKQHIEDRIINLGSGNTSSIYEVALIVQQEYKKRTGKICRIIRQGAEEIIAPPPAGERFRYSVGLAERYGFSQRIDLETGIKDLFDYIDQQAIEG